MDRRTFVTGAAAIPALAALTRSAALAQPGQPAVDVVERFGFVPDGRTDNYEAFHRLAAYATQAGGGHFVFPSGTYNVARRRRVPQANRDPREVQNAEYVGVDGLRISGYGAVIRLDGRTHRTHVHDSTFMPFEIRLGRNIVIEGLEMDGGIRDMTRELSVPEGYAHLVSLNGCSDVLLKDLDLHHSQVDAILLSDDYITSGRLPGRACRNVRLENVKCRNNGRGGLAALQVLGLSAVDCEFSGNGFPAPNYRGHPPGFGVDVEPDRSRPGENIDVKTGNLEFLRCTFNDNRSAILAAYPGNYQGYCRFIDCNSRNANNDPNHRILSWPGEGMLVRGGVHDAGRGCIWLTWQSPGSRVRLEGMTIRTSHIHGMLLAHPGGVGEVEDCEIIGTHTTAESGHFVFFAGNPGEGRRHVFRNNRMFIPAARKDHSRAFDFEPNFHHTDLEGNEYRTDLAVPGEYFVRLFNRENCTVRNERFRGAFPGRQDTIRPLPNDAHDTRLPFSSG
ncbi:MAG TPA: right-handed parallel beta-helix repeat-containing protein [Allosphingosinicella sp.]|nr:right-handed parallel beta-helix repeat-containing protein [Allosphingosinicella sp.]